MLNENIHNNDSSSNSSKKLNKKNENGKWYSSVSYIYFLGRSEFRVPLPNFHMEHTE